MKTLQGAYTAYLQAKVEIRIATAEFEDCLYMEYARGRSFREIAKELNMHHQTVSYLVNHAQARYAAAKVENHDV